MFILAIYTSTIALLLSYRLPRHQLSRLAKTPGWHERAAGFGGLPYPDF